MKILFIGFHHRVNDPRLFHREMKALKAHCEEVELFFLSPFKLYDLSDCITNDSSMKTLAMSEPKNNASKDMPPLRRKLKSARFRLERALSILRQIYRACALRPAVVQASDARELVWALIIRIFTGARIVFDAHEDYFNQIYEYSGKTLRSLIGASTIALVEVLCARLFEAVFCTDDSLYQKFRRPVYGCKNVFLLRNFPFTKDMPLISSYAEKNTLALIYVGGVNRYRGVIESAQYIAKFNQEHSPNQLTFTVYSSPHPIVDELVKQDLVRHVPWIEYRDLLNQLTEYDVGICLLHPIEKFYRNLPIKNFDYMGVGLPIITSNFGNLEKYARLSGAAICIDPLNYAEFESAVLELFDPRKREEMGKNGIAYTRSAGSFETEAEQYVRIITSGSL